MKHQRALMTCLGVLFLFVLIGSAWGSGPTLEWSRRFDGPRHGIDTPAAIASDGFGNVFVAGTMARGGDRTGYAIRKYDADGAVCWARQSDPRRTAAARALEVDASGNVIVTGESEGEFLTIKLDGNGNELWTRRYRTDTGHTDGARAIRIGDEGFIYVAGDSIPPGGASDYLVVKYDADGQVVHTYRYDGPAGKSDEVKALAVDMADDPDPLGGGTSDSVVVGDDFDIGVVGTFRHDESTGETVGVNTIAFDTTRNIYVTGRSLNESGAWELTTVKFNPEGDITLVDRYAGKSDGLDEAEGIAVDLYRNIYVAGTSAGDNGTDYVLIKIGQNRQRAWVRKYDGASGGDDRAKGIAVGPLCEVYVTGWSRDASLGALLTTVRYDNDGNLLWVSRYEDAPGAEDGNALISIDAFGKVMVAGSVSPARDAATGFLTRKLDTDGRVLWTRLLGAGAGSDSRPVAMAFDGSTNVLLTGTSQRSGGSVDFLTAKYGQSPLWETLNPTPYKSYQPLVAVDGAGHPHVCYREAPDGTNGLLRYATHDGTGWTKAIIEPHDVTQYAIAVDLRKRPVICYADEGLKCVTRDGSEWVETLVESEACASISVAVDSRGKPHLSYARTTSTPNVADLVYARHNGSKWIRETIAEGTASMGFGAGTSLALTADGKAHIIASDKSGELYWATNRSGSWEASGIGAGWWPSVVLDGLENPHVAFLLKDGDRRTYGYARHDGTRWMVNGDLAGAMGAAWSLWGDAPSIFMDRKGIVHIAFSGSWENGYQFVHAFKTGNGWAYDRMLSDSRLAGIAGRGDVIHGACVAGAAESAPVVKLFRRVLR